MIIEIYFTFGGLMFTNSPSIISFIKELFNLSFTSLDEARQIKDDFYSNIFTHTPHFLDSQRFKEFVDTLQPDCLYFMTDRFQLHYLLFFIDSEKVCLGPFCSVILTEQNCQLLLDHYQIKNISIFELQSYRGQFPNINEATGLNIAMCLIKTLDPSNTNRVVKKIDFFSLDSFPESDSAENTQIINCPYLIQQRYALEQRFMDNVKKGNSRAAILNLRNMQQDVAHLKQMGTTLENERIGAAIVRTMIRISALDAGLPAMVIDSLSKKNTVITIKANSIEEIHSAKETLVHDFCKEIHIHNQHLYSHLTQSAIYYMNHQLTQNLSIKQLAEVLDVTPSYLITKFRQETGLTPVAYINKIKMQQAANLLSRTNLPIQEISSLVGVADANYFIKLFKKEYHETPKNYRDHHKL